MKEYQELEIIRGETPTIPIIIPDYIDLSAIRDIRVSLTQQISNVSIQKTLLNGDIVLEGNVVNVEFSQEETLELSSDKIAQIQVNLLFNGGKRLPSKVGVVIVLPNNYGEVMNHE